MTDPVQSIALARSNLTAKLAELRRRESHARSTIAPLRHLANPWLHLGLAAFIGYRLGRRPAAAAISNAPTATGTMAGTIVRAGVVALGEAIVRRVANALVNESLASK